MQWHVKDAKNTMVLYSVLKLGTLLLLLNVDRKLPDECFSFKPQYLS